MSVDLVLQPENPESRTQGIRSASVLEMSSSKFRFHENVVRSVPTMSRSHIPLPHQLLSPWTSSIYSNAVENEGSSAYDNGYHGSVLSLLENRQMLDNQMPWSDSLPWTQSHASRDAFSDPSIDDIDDIDDIEMQEGINVEELKIPMFDGDSDENVENYDETEDSTEITEPSENLMNSYKNLSDDDDDFFKAFSSYSPLICDSGSEYERAIETVVQEAESDVETEFNTEPETVDENKEKSVSESETLRPEQPYLSAFDDNDDYMDLTSTTVRQHCINEPVPLLDIEDTDYDAECGGLLKNMFESRFFLEPIDSPRRSSTFEITIDEKGTMCLSERLEKERKRTRLLNKMKEKIHRVLGRRHQLFTR